MTRKVAERFGDLKPDLNSFGNTFRILITLIRTNQTVPDPDLLGREIEKL